MRHASRPPTFAATLSRSAGRGQCDRPHAPCRIGRAGHSSHLPDEGFLTRESPCACVQTSRHLLDDAREWSRLVRVSGTHDHSRNCSRHHRCAVEHRSLVCARWNPLGHRRDPVDPRSRWSTGRRAPLLLLTGPAYGRQRPLQFAAGCLCAITSAFTRKQKRGFIEYPERLSPSLPVGRKRYLLVAPLGHDTTPAGVFPLGPVSPRSADGLFSETISPGALPSPPQALLPRHEADERHPRRARRTAFAMVRGGVVNRPTAAHPSLYPARHPHRSSIPCSVWPLASMSPIALPIAAERGSSEVRGSVGGGTRSSESGAALYRVKQRGIDPLATSSRRFLPAIDLLRCGRAASAYGETRSPPLELSDAASDRRDEISHGNRRAPMWPPSREGSRRCSTPQFQTAGSEARTARSGGPARADAKPSRPLGFRPTPGTEGLSSMKRPRWVRQQKLDPSGSGSPNARVPATHGPLPRGAKRSMPAVT